MVERFTVEIDMDGDGWSTVFDPQGPYVRFSDYETIRAELEAVKRELGEAMPIIETQDSQAKEILARADKAAEDAARPITMQDVRLAVGEGKLRPIDVLNGVNAELIRRAAHRRPLPQENDR